MGKKQVIVTGGAGYIGSHTVVALHEAGFTPVIIDDFSNSKPEALEGIAKIIGTIPKFFEIDCCSRRYLVEVFKSCKSEGEVAGIIHFAAFKAVG